MHKSSASAAKPAAQQNNERINLHELLSLVVEAESNVQKIIGTPAVIVIGSTGHGKSTLINYLQRRQFHIKDRKLAVIPDSETISPIIGQGMVAETSFPEIFFSKTPLPFAFCDTAGFNDNRSLARHVVSYLSLKMAVNYAKEIKAIIVAVDTSILINRADANLKNLAFTIQQLLSHHEDYRTSLFFAFNKARDESGEPLDHDALLEIIKSHIADLESKSNPEFDGILKMLRIMAQCPQNLVIIRPTEPANLKEGRDRLLQLLEKSKPISKKNLTINVEKRNHVEYLAVITGIAAVYLNYIKHYIEKPKEIAALQADIDKINAEIAAIRKKNEEYSQKGVQNEVARKDLEGQNKTILGEIEQHRETIVRLRKEIDDKRHKIKILETDEEQELIYHKEYDEHEEYGEVDKGVVHCSSFTFDYQSQEYAPIKSRKFQGRTKHEDEGSDGYFDDPIEDDERNFQVKYTGPSHHYGEAEVDIYSLRKLLPHTKQKVNLKMAAITELEKQIPTSESSIKSLESQQTQVRASLSKVYENEVVSASQLIEQNNKIIDEKRKLITEHIEPKLKQLRDEVTTAAEALQNNADKFAMVERLNAYDPFTDDVVKEFIVTYKTHGLAGLKPARNLVTVFPTQANQEPVSLAAVGQFFAKAPAATASTTQPSQVTASKV